MLMLEQEVLNMQIAQSQAMETLQTDKLIQVMVPLRNPAYAREESAVALRKNNN